MFLTKSHADNVISSRDPGSDWPSLKSLITSLKSLKQFSLARQVAAIALASARWPDNERWLRQQQALCTYKDEELAAEERLAEALAVLLGPNGTLADPDWDAETLSLAGAIHKRRWEITGQRRTLEQAGRLYDHAIQAGKAASDVGGWTYAAINAAFVLDLLAKDMDDGDDPVGLDALGLRVAADALRLKALEYRQQVLDASDALLEKAGGHWWGWATLAEAQVGLSHYDKAAESLTDAMKAGADDWERESTARQLAALVELHRGSRFAGRDYAQAQAVLARLVDPLVAKALPMGKVGLALSGGGYRASLYHVGVLARLAELDLLRWVDTLSCVSGGSITGALYYLVMRGALEAKPTLDRQDYIDCVETVARLLVGVTASFDLRTRALLHSLVPCRGSLTEQIGRLLESSLYHPAAGTASGQPIPLTGLLVHPKDDPVGDDFHPRLHNWRRRDRVPMLVINATTLNTGHNWQFTASWTGEPPACIDTRVDASGRLRRFYLKDPTAPTRAAPLSLGQAVAASACIPLFPPLRLGRLYPGHDVRLADGGLHDNQGLFSLDEQGCAVMIVSDGSGQLQTETSPSGFLPKVFWRSNDILMQAGRRALFQLADARRWGNSLRERIYIHMKKGIEEADVPWYGGPLPPAPPGGCPGIHPDVQQTLAATRTDLDVFPETLARSLMYAGYVLSGRELQGAALSHDLADTSATGHTWSFTDVAELAAAPTPDYLRALQPLHGKMVGTLLSVWNEFKGWWRS